MGLLDPIGRPRSGGVQFVITSSLIDCDDDGKHPRAQNSFHATAIACEQTDCGTRTTAVGSPLASPRWGEMECGGMGPSGPGCGSVLRKPGAMARLASDSVGPGRNRPPDDDRIQDRLALAASNDGRDLVPRLPGGLITG